MWTSKLFWKVFSLFACLIAFSAILFGLLVIRNQERELRSQVIDRLRVAALFTGQLSIKRSPDPVMTADEMQTFVRRIAAGTGIRLTLMNVDGTVLADSDMPSLAAVADMENHRQRPEVQKALRDEQGTADRYSVTVAQSLVFYAVRVGEPSGPQVISRAALPHANIVQRMRQGRWIVALFTCSVIMVASAATWYLLAQIIHPLLELTSAVEATSVGNLRQRLEISNRDEIGMLARAFNRMNDELAAHIEQLRERGDQLAAVLGGMVEGVIAVDRRSNILFANDAAARLFAFRSEQARGRPLVTIARDEILHESVKQAMQTRGVVNAEIVRRSPTPGTLAVHATPLPGQPCPGVVLVFYDITRLRRLESLRQEFVANVSHELKTPLSSIKAYAETLLAGAIHDQSHNVQFVQRIEDQADRLHQLIMDLLSLARIESGQEAYEISAVEVGQAINVCLREHQQAAASKSIQLNVEPPDDSLVVMADDEGLRQILENLINNAIKYTPQGGKVTVRWKREGSSCLVEVADTGIGIDPEHHDRLFERFYRVDKARSRELGGTGLGLSIVKHLAQFFGGSVGVQSEMGKGSVFWVRLRLANGRGGNAISSE